MGIVVGVVAITVITALVTALATKAFFGNMCDSQKLTFSKVIISKFAYFFLYLLLCGSFIASRMGHG